MILFVLGIGVGLILVAMSVLWLAISFTIYESMKRGDQDNSTCPWFENNKNEKHCYYWLTDISPIEIDANYKIRVPSEEINKRVQELWFHLGGSWASGDTTFLSPSSAHLYLSKSKRMTRTGSSHHSYFDDHSNTEISAQAFLEKYLGKFPADTTEKVTFSAGDTVEVITGEISRWIRAEEAIGKRFTLTEDQAFTLNNGRTIHPQNNYYGINFLSKYFRRVPKEEILQSAFHGVSCVGTLTNKDVETAVGKMQADLIAKIPKIIMAEVPELLVLPEEESMAVTLKVGGKYVPTKGLENECSSAHAKMLDGGYIEITQALESGYINYKIFDKDDCQHGTCNCYKSSEIAPYKSKKGSIMTQLSTIAKKLLDADTKTLVKAGYLDSELELTDEGREALEGILITTYKKELVAAAKQDIKDAKDDSDEE